VSSDDPGRPTQVDGSNTADLLERLLELVDAGEIDASSAHAKRLLRRIEGAIFGLRAEQGGA
jgi:hypothetical protein